MTPTQGAAAQQQHSKRGYILYPPVSRKHIGFQLSPKSHAIKAAEMEYQIKRNRSKKYEGEDSDKASGKAEKYQSEILKQAESSKGALMYQPRITQEEKM